jgi:uncharacterized protein (TIGR02145 family)
MKKLNRSLVLLLFTFTFCNAFLKAQESAVIGEKTWTTKNLDVATFRNGDPIEEAKTYSEWDKAEKQKKPAWCYYDNKKENGPKYGKLYNWWAISDARNLAPAGWHIPDNQEWDKMIESLGGKKEAGAKLKIKSWDNGDNSTGFNGQPAGLRQSLSGGFGGMDNNTFWWSFSPETLYGMNSRRKTWILKTSCYKSGREAGQFCYTRLVKD